MLSKYRMKSMWLVHVKGGSQLELRGQLIAHCIVKGQGICKLSPGMPSCEQGQRLSVHLNRKRFARYWASLLSSHVKLQVEQAVSWVHICWVQFHLKLRISLRVDHFKATVKFGFEDVTTLHSSFSHLTVVCDFTPPARVNKPLYITIQAQIRETADGSVTWMCCFQACWQQIQHLHAFFLQR